MDDREDDAPKATAPKVDERQARLAAALRANLRRRKASGAKPKS
jgi:hypothetical protein